MSVKRFIQLCLIVAVSLVSLAGTSQVRAASWCGSTYVIQRGDWLSRIAQKCGVTLAELRAANPWTYSSRYIYPGQILIIPGGYVEPDNDNTGGYCGPSWDAYGSYWRVCRGDTLGQIARYYGVNWHYLQWNNDIPNPNLIYPGQVIRL